ncbi:efflux RND transporter periplasmic adaptor subunit [Agriterribacter humi]|jgi:RND family efflux transporter MFP subunit|uniref:efflux RND transporter periplasmic adaptor subunit n=1 Tax=Agriterribacter humi TaxID=1104781 RepID=UPI0012659B04|nr:efflux RND transporter periplasmic adaptor subunit [Agriterribacter humi]
MTKSIAQFSLVILFFTACTEKKNSKNTETAGEVRDTVPVFVLTSSDVSKSIELPAELLPYETADLTAKVEAYVKEMRVDIGDEVRKGQTLAVLDAPEIRTKSAEYKSALFSAKARYQSSKDVYDRLYNASQAKSAGIVAPVDLEKSRNQKLADSAAYESAKSLAQSYNEVAGYLLITAPFDGIVTARNADRGALVGQTVPIFTVQHTRTLRLRVAVPELYVSTGTAGKEVQFSVQSNPNKSFAAQFVRKSGAIDPKNRTEIWEYLFVNKNNQLKAGSFAYVKLNLQRDAPSFVVAPGTIATNQERKFVIAVRNGKTEWVDVRQGMSTEKGIEIFGDLKNGDTLVVRATDERKAGAEAVWKINP